MMGQTQVILAISIEICKTDSGSEIASCLITLQIQLIADIQKRDLSR